MPTVNTYLTFDGNCEKAFEFYKQIFETDFSYLSRFDKMPEDPKYPMTSVEKNKIMHVSLPIGNTVLMGSDTGGEWAKHYKTGNNFSVSVQTDSKQQADALFNALARNGQITVPIKATFWGSYFGMLIDQFGIQWMMSYDA
jgi:PhnB protein